MGLEAPEPPEAMESFVFLCHAPDMTLSEEQLVGARLGSDAKDPLGIVRLLCSDTLRVIGCWRGPASPG